MTTMASLKTRLPLIQAAATLATVERRDGEGRVRTVRVPGHEGLNLVILSRDGVTLIGECQRDTGVGLVPCPGYNYGRVCYHLMAGAMVAVEKGGYRVIGWSATEREAQRLLNLKQFKNCHIGRLVPKGGSDVVYFLWR